MIDTRAPAPGPGGGTSSTPWGAPGDALEVLFLRGPLSPPRPMAAALAALSPRSLASGFVWSGPTPAWLPKRSLEMWHFNSFAGAWESKHFLSRSVIESGEDFPPPFPKVFAQVTEAE